MKMKIRVRSLMGFAVPAFLISMLLLLPVHNGAEVAIGAPKVYPGSEKIESGKELSIYVSWVGDVLLETQYPGVNFTWIMEPDAVIDDNYTFKLTGPYTDGNLSIRAVYSPGPDTSNLSFTDWKMIEVIGYIDEDDDGLSDVWEMKYDVNSDNSSDDKDEDGLSLFEEMLHLTDPKKRDTDGDSMDDMWESLHGTLPFQDDPNDDPDLDGWSNIQEKVKGTDPRDPDDHPDDLPVTPWYWTLAIVIVLLLILAYFVRQMFSKKKLEDDMEDFDRKVSGKSSRK